MSEIADMRRNTLCF